VLALCIIVPLYAFTSLVVDGGYAVPIVVAVTVSYSVAAYMALREVAKPLVERVEALLASIPRYPLARVSALAYSASRLRLVESSWPLIVASAGLAVLPLLALTYTSAWLACRVVQDAFSAPQYKPMRPETLTLVLTASLGLAAPAAAKPLERLRACLEVGLELAKM
jgi:hypothetical protein